MLLMNSKGTTKFGVIISGFFKIIDGLIMIYSLGHWIPGYEIKFTGWMMRKYVKEMIKKEQINNESI